MGIINCSDHARLCLKEGRCTGDHCGCLVLCGEWGELSEELKQGNRKSVGEICTAGIQHGIGLPSLLLQRKGKMQGGRKPSCLLGVSGRVADQQYTQLAVAVLG